MQMHLRVILLGFLTPIARNIPSSEAGVIGVTWQTLLTLLPVLGSFITVSITPVTGDVAPAVITAPAVSVPGTDLASHPLSSVVITPTTSADAFAGTPLATADFKG